MFLDEVWGPKRYCGGGALDEGQVTQLAAFLEQQVLPRLQEGARMFFDGSITSEPDDGTFYREESELWRNYSLRHDVLVEVIAWLGQAEGAVVLT